MLKDNIPSNNQPTPNDLSVGINQEIVFILDFIDRNISNFIIYYLKIRDSDRENRISYFLSCYFNACLVDEKDGFCSFNFVKNPAQESSTKETDIGVVPLSKTEKPTTIIEFEAKRFSETSNNKEYVCGDRGGIERFKRGYHSAHLLVCGMFAYVQSRKSEDWINKVNEWIKAESENNKDLEIDWKSINEKLITNTVFKNVNKLKSVHSRKQLKDTILLWHYFINLC